MRLRKFLSLLLVILLLTSVTIPSASAGEVLPFVPVVAATAPAWTEMAYWGFTVVMTGAAALGIALQLGKTWDGEDDSWKQLMIDTGKELDNLFNAKHPKHHEKKDWVCITDDKAQATMKAMYECCYTGVAGDGKKRDNKWYFEARRHNGQIEINMEKRLNEDEALIEMGRGKDIMTVSQGHAARLVGRFEDLPSRDIMNLDFEGKIHDPECGVFKHFHYTAQNMRLHCWAWSEDWLV